MLCLKKAEETNHFQYKYTFYNQKHIRWISKFYYNYTTSKLNFWLWNKRAYIWQWKDKEDCVTKTILMHYSFPVYFVNQPLRVSGIFVAHHQEVYCMYIQQMVCVVLFSWLSVGWPTDSQLKRFLLHRCIEKHGQQNIKNKEGCSSIEVPYVILIIWMTIATT